MPILMIEKGPEKGNATTFKQSLTIGRDVQCEIKLSDTSASRKHCKIYTQDGQYYLEDLESLNGTQLNGKFLNAPAILKDGDQVGIGETLIVWQEKERKDTLVNHIIAGYQILKRLGKGGMGTVYLAKQLSLDRDVAVKILDPKVAHDQTFSHLFIAEARSCAKLNHPNIIQVYDAGEDQGYSYFSMEYAKGGSLQSLIAGEKKLTWQEALPLMIDTASGLEYAEKNKIVHRDIKPDNLMLTEEKRIKIVDLGLARRFDQSPEIPESGIYGTPLYVSPEQARGMAIDFRADMYSFGAAYYRVLSGHPPFRGKSVPHIITQHLKDPPIPLKTIVSDIPYQLSDMIDTMMQKKPEERYSSNSLIIQELRQLQDIANNRQSSAVVQTRVRRNLNKSTISVNRKEARRRPPRNSLVKPWTIVSGILSIFLFFMLISILVSNPENQVEISEDNRIEKEYNDLYAKYQLQGDTDAIVAQWDEFYEKNRDSLYGKKALENANRTRQILADKREKSSQNAYQTAQRFEKDHPEELINIIKNYTNIIEEFPQTSFARLARNDIKRLENREDSKKQKILQDLRQVMEKFEILCAKEDFAHANEILNTFRTENPDDETVVEQIQLRQKTLLETKIPDFIKKISTEIRKNIQEKNIKHTKELVQKLVKNRSFPAVAKALKEFSSYLDEEPTPVPPTVQETPIISPPSHSKLPTVVQKALHEFDFTQAMQESKKNNKLANVTQDIAILQNFFKKLHTSIQKKHLPVEGDEFRTVLSFIGGITPQSIHIIGLENNKITFEMMNAGVTITKGIAIKNFSAEWIYHSILFPICITNKNDFLEIALFCYYYHLYQDAWYWKEKLATTSAEKAKYIEGLLQFVEDNAKKDYSTNIIPIYKQSRELKERMEQEVKESQEYLLLQEQLKEKTLHLKECLEEYRKIYENTRFYDQIR